VLWAIPAAAAASRHISAIAQARKPREVRFAFKCFVAVYGAALVASSDMTSPCFQLHETRELNLRFEEEGLKGPENFPRRHYPDRVLGYFLSPADAEHPCLNNVIETLSARFGKSRRPGQSAALQFGGANFAPP
jgi:hypothetical protein